MNVFIRLAPVGTHADTAIINVNNVIAFHLTAYKDATVIEFMNGKALKFLETPEEILALIHGERVV